jgi:dipeptidyl aminopeptidase/acylaminoacyl peptidase
MVAGAAALPAQEGTNGARQPITPEDYGQWERLGAGELSPDGRWLAYGISRVNEEDELRMRLVGTDSLIVASFGSGPEFSDDGEWLAFTIGMSDEERDKLREAKKPARDKLGLLNLTTGEMETIEDVSAFAFSGADAFLAMHRYRPEGQEEWNGADLLVRTLAIGVDVNFGNVAEFRWQDEGQLLALTIDAAGQAGNGIHVFDPRDGTIRILESRAARYRGLAWRDESADVAVLRARSDSLYEDSTHVILAWKNVTDASRATLAFDPEDRIELPIEHRVVEHRPLGWSKSGETIFFGIQERLRKPEGDSTETDDDDVPTVEIWNAVDVEIIPEQKVRRTRNRERSYLTAWHLNTDHAVRLGTELTEEVERAGDDRHAFGTDVTPYDADRMFGPEYRDVFLIDVESGDATRIAERVQFRFGASPGGRYFLYFKDDHYWAYDVDARRLVNVTENVAATLTNLKDNHTVEQKPPFRIAGWTEDDASVLIYDEYDIWEVAPDGSGGTRLTNGAADRVRHRYIRLDPEEESIQRDEPVYLSLYGEWTEEWGLARMRLGNAPERLVWREASVGRLTKARDVSVLAYTIEDVDDSPDYFVGGPTLRDARQVTQTNPFHADYAWGDSELLNYENTWGEPLQGALFYPANYEPGRQYPMIVYIYEVVAPSVRQYTVPSDRSAYNTSVFTSLGYFVYRADITYRDRNPGLSAVEALEPAVARALETGMIDSSRVGLVGHSWGGYQTAFAVTQTDIFSAAVAGAPLTNLTSMYLSVYWNSGGTDARIFEISQGRMEVPFWEDVDSYLANSPVFHVDKLNTPLLVAHGTEDGAVDYNQGVEYYNAARRAGKDFVLLSYNGENHGNRQKANQIDYHRRILEWFGHYLKGDPAPDWITKGLPYEDQQRMLKMGVTSKTAIIP